MSLTAIDFALLKWLRSPNFDEAFPRDFMLSRSKIISYNTDINLFSPDTYLAVFSDKQIEREEFDTIYVDIDAHKGESLRTLLDELRDVLAANRLAPSRAYMTGRGFALFFDLKTPIHGRDTYKKTCMAFLEGTGLKVFADKGITGDVRRMGRVPYSFNAKGTRWMVEISIFDDFDHIVWASKHRKLMEKDTALKVDVEPYLLYLPEQRQNRGARKEDIPEGKTPACIERAIKTIVETGELDHDERRHLASYMIQQGEVARMHELLHYASDYDEGISNYQMKYLADNNYLPSKCSNVPDSICPYMTRTAEHCPFAPSIAYTMGWRK